MSSVYPLIYSCLDGQYKTQVNCIWNKKIKQEKKKCKSKLIWIKSDYPLSTDKLFVICRCLPPDRPWHKVNDPKAVYSEDLGEGKVGHELRLEPCWSLLFTDPLSVMWA